MKFYLTFTLLLFSFICVSLFAQSKREADELFSLENFESAAHEYTLLLEEDPTNVHYNYNAAICYLNLNEDKSLAIEHLEKVMAYSPNNADAFYFLGKAYQYSYKFEDAILYFTKFKQFVDGKNDNKRFVELDIQHCKNAMILNDTKNDQVKLTNLGKHVNSIYDDYYPFVPKDERYIVFNSNRDFESLTKENGEQYTNVYMSKTDRGNFGKAKKLVGKLNTDDGDEQVVGLSSDGNHITVYKENYKILGDLFQAKITSKGEIKKLRKFNDNVNSKYTEIAGSMNEEFNRFYFASDRPGGLGGVDIYYCNKLPNGKWGKAINAGNAVNTKYDEDFPNTSPDGNWLYFSSKGHNSGGGYDIFKTKIEADRKSFSTPTNLGFPINTPEDDMNLRISENGRFGYLSTYRKGGLGGLDIYRVTFKTVPPRNTVVKGNVDINKEDIHKVTIAVFKESNGDLVGEYAPHSKTGNYIAILAPGKYSFSIEAEGYTPIEKEIEIFDKSSFEVQRELNFEMK